MYWSSGSYIVCCGCKLDDGEGLFRYFKKRTDAANHLLTHINVGHEVPAFAFDRLQEEIEEEGNLVAYQSP
jgi:hypothetical protein